ncbi:MAG: protein kinase, partial [Candidatus Eisenbacteria bacterium]|nr:protein kinase [Candidatus Eisenbacteria bacterium]
DRSGQSSDWEDAVLQEGRLLARCEHPNVVRIYGAEKRDGRLGIWMEFIQGTSLQSLLNERGKLSWEEVADMGRDLASALQTVHDANVVHRDVKAENVMRDVNGRIVLMDFGAGKGRALPQTSGQATGTALYMAPEVFEGVAATPQSDIYALGVLLYHLLTGEYPVQASSITELIQSHKKGEAKNLRDALGADHPLAQIVDTALHVERTSRHTSAASMGEALDKLTAPTAKPVAATVTRRNAQAFLVPVMVALIAAIAGMMWLNSQTPLQGEVDFVAVNNDGVQRALIAGDQITYSDLLQMQVKLNHEAYLYVLNMDEAGSSTVIFPMPGGDLTNPLPAKGVMLPGPVDGVEKSWTMNSTRGTESFIIVASKEPLNQFETQLTAMASIDIGSGMRVTPADGEVLLAMVEPLRGILEHGDQSRGVSGITTARDVQADANAKPRELLLDLVRSFADEGEKNGSVWMQEVSLTNPGQ